MNYAEDRLDRRARSSHSSSADVTRSTHDQLACDLRKSHEIFARHNVGAAKADADDDHADAGRRPAEKNAPLLSDQEMLRELREAHELAGKTLRDGGKNRQAIFHFGMAWKICHWLEKKHDRTDEDNDNDDDVSNTNRCGRMDNTIDDRATKEAEWRSVGDYAQICDLSGFPEIGALALLFYRAGGNLDVDKLMRMDSGTITDTEGDDEGTQMGCGCGMAGCGSTPCFIAFPCSSHVLDMILCALDELSFTSPPTREIFPEASDILSQLALMTRKADTIGNPVDAMHGFLSQWQILRGIPSILQFWDNDNEVGMAYSQTETTDRRDDKCCRTNNQQTQTQQQPDRFQKRTLPPVILLLLLKLLYSSPISGPFLQLACLSMPYLAARFPPASREGRLLARYYKSHWAYYVFIRALVLGERVKKHRRTRGIYHVPIWDVVFGFEEPPSTDRETDEKKDEFLLMLDSNNKVSNYLCRTLQACSPNSGKPISNSNATNNGLPFHRHNSALPSIIQHRIPSYSTHAPIFVVGDSHVLSLAWRTLCIHPSMTSTNSDGFQNPIYRTAVPYPATGLKAWHVRSSTRFFTHYNLRTCLQRIPSSSLGQSIILSAGEIDCREGIGGSLLQGYYHNCSDAVERTVKEYLSALAVIAEEYELKILLMPVAPHAYRSEKNGKSVGRARRRETMCLWNKILRRELARGQTSTEPDNIPEEYCRIFLLDYERKLQHADKNSPVGYVLHPSYNADYTHVNGAILPLVEDAILHCGCDLILL